MKLTIGKIELQRALSRIQAIVDKRTSMPILANVLLEAGSGKLQLAATDLEVGIRDIHAAQVETPGSLTVSAKKFFEIIRELPEEMVTLEATPNSFLDIRCARSHFTLAGTTADEYPTLPDVKADKTVSLQAVVLSTMIERVMYATSTDETRYNLNGVYVEFLPDSGKVRMVATDGHRLAYIDRSIGKGLDHLTKGVIIPRKALVEVKRLVDEDDADEIEFGFEGNSCVVRRGNVTLSMRLIEGEFPNYKQVIPKAPSVRLVIARELLTQAIRRVALLSTERTRAIRCDLSSGRLLISSSNPDLGEAQEEIDVDYAGKEVMIGFNANYLRESLGVIKSKEVELGLQDELSPVQLRPSDDMDSLSVIMPMRL